MFTFSFPDATKDQKWSQFRLWRMQQLQLSDWTQALDCTLDEQSAKEFRDYRAFLKDAPSNFDSVEDIDFPGFVGMVDYKIVYIKHPYKAA